MTYHSEPQHKGSPSSLQDILHVDLGDRSYDIHIGAGLMDNIAGLMPWDVKGRTVFLLSDENVMPLYGQQVAASFVHADARAVETLTLPAGEQTKSYDHLREVLDWLLDHNMNRQSVLVALGGGVIGDLGGFAAAIAMRGIPYVQVPTTLLAQVDSAVGGKTAIDTPQGKNLVGAFYQPEIVVADTQALSSLPARDLKAGYAEVVKYGLIEDKSFFEWLDKHGRDVCALGTAAHVIQAVKTSCAAKARIVEADEKEGGKRALLNLGHTFGHALEVCAGYDGRLLHGEAVSVGMVLAFDLSARMGLCSRDDADKVIDHLRRIGLPVKISDIPVAFETRKLLVAMQRDKKMTTSGLKFILVKGIGQAFITKDVKQEDVAAVIDASLAA